MHQSLGIIQRITLVLGVLAALAGCDSRSANSGGQTGPAEVRVGYFANVTHAQAVLGVASGDFERAVAPAKLTTKVFNAGPSLIEALFAGEIDVGYVGPGPAINAHAKSRGVGLRVLAGAAANGVLIVARPDSGIAGLEDLKGKRIATPQLGNTQDISARHYLKTRLGQSDLSNVLPIANAEQVAMMARGQIDAAWAPEPWGSRLVAEAGAKVVGEEKDLWPGKQFTLTLVVTTPEFLRKHPDVVEKLLKVHCDWTARLQKDPKACTGQLGAALEKLTGKSLPPGVLDSAVANVTFTNEPLEETLTTFAQWSYELEFAKQPADLKGLVDTTLLRRVHPQPPAAAPPP